MAGNHRSAWVGSPSHNPPNPCHLQIEPIEWAVQEEFPGVVVGGVLSGVDESGTKPITAGGGGGEGEEETLESAQAYLQQLQERDAAGGRPTKKRRHR